MIFVTLAWWWGVRVKLEGQEMFPLVENHVQIGILVLLTYHQHDYAIKFHPNE